MDPKALLTEFCESGFKATVVATKLDEGLLGRNLDKGLLDEIESFGCHPCGEAGEYHTFVTDGPVFRMPLKVTQSKKEKRDNVWFLEISAELQ